MGISHSGPGKYTEPTLEEGVLEVRISVYKLPVSGYHTVDHLFGDTLGVYHSACVVGGIEFAFGGHDEEGKSGVYRGKPEKDPNYHFYNRVVMGRVMMTQKELKDKIVSMAPKWSGTSYDIVERNCNHFSSDLCWDLMKKRPPAWINYTAEELLLQRRKTKVAEQAVGKALTAWQADHAVASLKGAEAFEECFTKTFDSTFKAGLARGQKDIVDKCTQDQDAVELKNMVINDVLAAAERAAAALAGAVASASSAATPARASVPLQPHAALKAWDNVWKRESNVLIKAWRKAALEDAFRPEGKGDREHKVKAALADAALAVEEAIKKTSHGTKIEWH